MDLVADKNGIGFNEPQNHITRDKCTAYEEQVQALALIDLDIFIFNVDTYNSIRFDIEECTKKLQNFTNAVDNDGAGPQVEKGAHLENLIQNESPKDIVINVLGDQIETRRSDMDNVGGNYNTDVAVIAKSEIVNTFETSAIVTESVHNEDFSPIENSGGFQVDTTTNSVKSESDKIKGGEVCGPTNDAEYTDLNQAPKQTEKVGNLPSKTKPRCSDNNELKASEEIEKDVKPKPIKLTTLQMSTLSLPEIEAKLMKDYITIREFMKFVDEKKYRCIDAIEIVLFESQWIEMYAMIALNNYGEYKEEYVEKYSELIPKIIMDKWKVIRDDKKVLKVLLEYCNEVNMFFEKARTEQQSRMNVHRIKEKIKNKASYHA